jgi:pimeloyl-ACP methyl ester carboxylesterase
MATFILIHGGWHGPWCWYKVAPLLRAQDHIVIRPFLPGHGNDKTPHVQITLDTYIQSIKSILEKAIKPVILVGHSMAGIILSQIAEYFPEKISLLVYLAAFMLQDQETLVNIASQDGESLILPFLNVDVDTASIALDTNGIEKFFYHDCDEADIKTAISLLCPQPLKPLITPLSLSERYASVKKIYIETLSDRSISNLSQLKMYSKQSCQKIIRLNTGHSPFFSAPDHLAFQLLDNIGTI